MTATQDLIARYQYGARYITDYDLFREQVLNKSVIPHQVEVQPASPSKEICWLKCPWCYGLSATDTGERLSKERAVTVMQQIASGGVRKVIFAGYATDPLNCRYIEDLLEVAVDRHQIFGFNTKAIRVSERLLELLSTPSVVPNSYLAISVDAGSNHVFNLAHAVENQQVKLYDRILTNVERLANARAKSGAWFDISAAYLINETNSASEEVLRFVRNFRDAGCNLLRFTFPQLPRGFVPAAGIIPSKREAQIYASELRALIEAENSDQCAVMFVDADTTHDIFRKPRTVPCFARFVYPSVGFDGWLYHCSQSSAPNFRSMALGDLTTSDFWDLYYDYDADDLRAYFDSAAQRMAATGCRCDRKEHVMNTSVLTSGAFPELHTS